MNLRPLRSLLRPPYSDEALGQILIETSRLYREDLEHRWFFLLLNRVFVRVLDNPDLTEPDTAEPVLQTLSAQALIGLTGIEQRDRDLLISAANQITEAYCGFP
jgi:hypothetical protein